jgi:DNA-binding NarL/FixJ family response regulator
MKQGNPVVAVILVDDHELVRKGLRTLLELEADIQVLDEATDGIEAVQLARTLNPTVVVMDIALPRLNGVEAARQILATHPEAKILVLSAHSEDKHIGKLASMGVMGFLMKQCSPHLLVKAIHDIASGKKVYSPLILQRIEMLNKKKAIFPMTMREMQVLQLVAESMANKQVADVLKISIKTVEKHRQSIMNKLLIHDTAGLTRYAIAEGIIECSSGSKSHS